MSEEGLTKLAVKLVLAVLHSASTDVIKPIDWWSRAKTGLVVAAAISETYAQLVSKYLDKLQVVAPKVKTAIHIAKIEKIINEKSTYEEFRKLCERDAHYIVAMAQVERKQQCKQKR